MTIEQIAQQVIDLRDEDIALLELATRSRRTRSRRSPRVCRAILPPCKGCHFSWLTLVRPGRPRGSRGGAAARRRTRST